MTAPASRRGGQGGYVLLEALIAVVIAAVGFIGAARMQTLGLAMNNSTQVRQKATLLGYQMADRIRANQAGVSARAYDRRRPGRRPAWSPRPAARRPSSPAPMSREWQSEIAAQLPGGTGVVCLDSTPDDGAAAAPLVRRRRQRHRGQAVVGRQGRLAALRRQREAMTRSQALRSVRATARGMTLGRAHGRHGRRPVRRPGRGRDLRQHAQACTSVGSASTRMRETPAWPWTCCRPTCATRLPRLPAAAQRSAGHRTASPATAASCRPAPGLRGNRGTGAGFAPALTGPLAALPAARRRTARERHHLGARPPEMPGLGLVAAMPSTVARRRSRRARRPTRSLRATSS